MDPENKSKLINIKQKIISFIGIRGPVLPVHAAKETGISMLFASAFLSELVSEKTLKISNMKVGGSPLYFLPGQESRLESFYNYLPGKEKEAFMLLKIKKILQDNKQEPAIRVALRSIKDFAFPFKLDSDIEIFWRFFTLPEQEAMKEVQIIKLRENQIIKVEKPAEKPEVKLPEEKTEVKPERKEKQQLIEVKPIIKKKKEKEKPLEFLNDVKEFLIRKDIELLQEIFYDKKEVIAKIRINSDLGKMIFLLIARNKKKVSESDLISAYQKAINEKMPCYFLSRGDFSDKTTKNIEQFKNLIKFDKIN